MNPYFPNLSRRSLHPRPPQNQWPPLKVFPELKIHPDCAAVPNVDLMIEEWNLFSVWTGEVDSFLIELQKLGCSPRDKQTFLANLSPFVNNLFLNFPVGIDKSYMVLIVKGYGTLFRNGVYEVDAAEIPFLDTQTQTRPAFKLRCQGKLAQMFGAALKQNDILIIPQHGNGGSTPIVRLVGMGNAVPSGVTLGERIETKKPMAYENPWEARYCFEYVLNVPGGSVGIIRHRQAYCHPFQRPGNLSYLEKFLFPILSNASIMDVVNGLGYYDAYQDPSWPQMYGGGQFWMGPPRVPR